MLPITKSLLTFFFCTLIAKTVGKDLLSLTFDLNNLFYVIQPLPKKLHCSNITSIVQRHLNTLWVNILTHQSIVIPL